MDADYRTAMDHIVSGEKYEAETLLAGLTGWKEADSMLETVREGIADDAAEAGRSWLLEHKNADGLYGDSPESPANLTATFLAYAALRNSHADHMREAEAYLNKTFGGLTFEAVKAGLLKEYGKDLTFSVPLLALATASGFFSLLIRV